MIKSSIGLGFLLYMGRELNDASQVIGIMVLTIIFGLLMDRFFSELSSDVFASAGGLKKITSTNCLPIVSFFIPCPE